MKKNIFALIFMISYSLQSFAGRSKTSIMTYNNDKLLHEQLIENPLTKEYSTIDGGVLTLFTETTEYKPIEFLKKNYVFSKTDTIIFGFTLETTYAAYVKKSATEMALIRSDMNLDELDNFFLLLK